MTLSLVLTLETYLARLLLAPVFGDIHLEMPSALPALGNLASFPWQKQLQHG